METETLAGALEREHREIDAGIEAVTSGDAGALSGAIEALRRHIYLEEEFLFRLLCQAEPALSAPAFVMLREHGQIWQLLDALQREPAGAEGSGTLCRQLAVLLLHHNLKEEKVLYPEADALLAEPVAARLGEYIASRQLPVGWTCRKAAAAR
jgi:hemerythrin-like domain-containing protein